MEIYLEPNAPLLPPKYLYFRQTNLKNSINFDAGYLVGGEGCRVRNNGQCSPDQFKCKNENKNQILSINDFNKEREKCIPLYYRCDGR